ncbi:hypothetical protein [uncultured Aquimarina sp.]|uniref:hypothetical protein n=1 Tax=uncultured Aquimarina sp. TaxID=575652 RepID=UPI002609888F|nr:hypothetical protein [uncultured Aquimarina sp.]
MNCKKDEDLLNVPTAQYAHFSVDDVISALQDVSNENYESIFDHPFFSVWKGLHDNYGATVTFNLFYSKQGFDLSQMTEKFKAQFMENSYWLKFSFHAGDVNENYNSSENNANAIIHYNNTYSQIIRFAGQESLETFCRLHFFSGNKDLFISLKQTVYGLNGIHTADDFRELNSGLTQQELDSINKHNKYYDAINKLYYIRSERRLDRETITEVTQSFQDNISSTSDSKIYNYFLHEATAVNQSPVLDSLCKLIVAEGIKFDFPSNNIP